jgi:hypothetical protein
MIHTLISIIFIFSAKHHYHNIRIHFMMIIEENQCKKVFNWWDDVLT